MKPWWKEAAPPVALKSLVLIAFVGLTNSGIAERVLLLVDQERYRAVTLYFGFWGCCLACLVLVAFHPALRWRLFWATVIAVTTFAGYMFMRVTDSQLTVFHAVALWTARIDASRAAGYYADEAAIALAAAALGFVALVMRPPRLHPLVARGMSVLSLAPAVPVVALAVMIAVRIGEDTVAMPQQFAPAAIAAVAAVRLAGHEMPVKDELQVDPVRPAAARHIVLIVDESVRAEFVSFREGNPVTPFLAGARHRFVDFGESASGNNCSASANAILRFGAGPGNLRRSIGTSPYVWDFARRAGFRTVYIDATSSHIRKPAALQNYMTLREKALIDEYVMLDGDSDPARLDLMLSRRIAAILARPEPHFIYANKNGAHFPYDKSYPPAAAVFHPTESEDTAAPNAARLNSYRNAVHWAVDVFFEDFLGRADLSRTAVLYTSDHGQNLHVGKATHCSGEDAAPEEGRVPLFFVSGQEDLMRRFAAAAEVNFGRASHFAIFPTLITLFGYQPADLDYGYARSLLEEITLPQFFTSGDILGGYGGDIWWNPIDGLSADTRLDAMPSAPPRQ